MKLFLKKQLINCNKMIFSVAPRLETCLLNNFELFFL